MWRPLCTAQRWNWSHTKSLLLKHIWVGEAMGGFIIKCRQRVFIWLFIYLFISNPRRHSALPFLINPGLNCAYRHLDLCLAKSRRVDKQRQFGAVLATPSGDRSPSSLHVFRVLLVFFVFLVTAPFLDSLTRMHAIEQTTVILLFYFLFGNKKKHNKTLHFHAKGHAGISPLNA